MKTLVVQRVGSNRGGWDSFFQTWQVAGGVRGVSESNRDVLERLGLPDPVKLPVKLEVVDPKENRAVRLASAWQLRGVPAIARQATIEECLNEDVDVRVLAIDNPAAIALTIERGRQRVTIGGILVAANFPPGGGRVIGVGFTVQDADCATKADAGLLMRMIAKLVGKPTHSQEMAEPLQTPQMISTRRLLHRELAIDTLRFMDGQEVGSRLFAVETLAAKAPHTYHLEVAEVEATLDRRNLDEQTVQTARKIGKPTVVAFWRKDATWLYLPFVHQLDEWVVRHRVELPAPEEYLKIFEEARPREQELFAHVTTTD